MEVINISNNSNLELKSKLSNLHKSKVKTKTPFSNIKDVDISSYENAITIHKNDLCTNCNIEFVFKLNLNFETDDKLSPEFEKKYGEFKYKINTLNELLIKKNMDFKISDFKINENYLNNYYNELHVTYKNINIEKEDNTYTIIKNVLEFFKLNLNNQNINITIKNVIGGNISYKEGTLNEIIKIK
jgi:hypothetical protein